MTTEDIDTDYVCHGCIGNRVLVDIVRAEGTRVACSYCDGVSEAMPLDDFAHRIHEVLQEHFVLSPSQPTGLEYAFAKEGHWAPPGYPVADVIADIVGICEKITTNVRELLSEFYGYHAVKGGEEDPYSSDAYYEERGAEDSAWKMFCEHIRYHGRFFNSYAEDELKNIFGDLRTHKTFRSKPVIRELSPGGDNSPIWRARTALSSKELKAILKAPAREIGPPPPRLTKGGRMNASGIPVFYGAMEKETCVAELRAPVGSQVVLAKFELLRPVRLLDLGALTEIWNIEANHFDPDYGKHEGRAASLRSLASEICRPVMPQDEAFEYLPSQAVAEYLSNKLDTRLDGIIFPSSQTDGAGRNVVLFNHACAVAPYDLPKGTKVEVDLPRKHDEDGEEDEENGGTIMVFETVPQTCSTPPRTDGETLFDLSIFSPEWSEDDIESEELSTWSKPTLRLDMKSVLVLDIRSVRYEHHRREVFRHRSAKGEA